MIGILHGVVLPCLQSLGVTSQTVAVSRFGDVNNDSDGVSIVVELIYNLRQFMSL